MPTAIDMCREICGDAVANKQKSVPVLNSTIHRRTESAAQDIKEQLVARIYECKQFTIPWVNLLMFPARHS